VISACCSQEDLQAIQESIAEELEESGLRSKLRDQIRAARLQPSKPGVGPVSTSTVVEALQKKGLALERDSAIESIVNTMANYDSPDSTVMEYLWLTDKASYEAWQRVAALRDQKDRLLRRLHEEERAVEEAFRGAGNAPTMKAVIDAYMSSSAPPNPKGESRM
jgi:hypothetical protein